jgi:putative transposase
MVIGHERHSVVDLLGNQLHVSVHAANCSDTVAGGPVTAGAAEKHPSIEAFSGDAGYRGTAVKFVDETLGLILHISTKIKDGWVVLPKRWVDERSFAWLGRFRRLSQGFRDPDWGCREYDPYRHARENACKLRLNYC